MTWQELNKTIESEKERGFFKAKFHKGNYTNWKGICNRFISGSTVRALRDGQYKPKSFLQHWAKRWVFNKEKTDLHETFKSKLHEKSFPEFHKWFVKTLVDYWNSKNLSKKSDKGSSVKKKNGFKKGHANKIIDVFLKTLILFDQIDKKTRNKLIQNAYVPLDSITLTKLRKLLNDYYFNPNKLKPLPPNPTMGDMNKKKYENECIYYGIQNIIRSNIDKKYSLIFVDFVLWDLNEKETIIKLEKRE